MADFPDMGVSRRGILAGGAASATVAVIPAPVQAQPSPAAPPPMMAVDFIVNGKRQQLKLDTRTTLLDALRERSATTHRHFEELFYSLI